MKTLLFVILPYPSHYLASFGFARIWQKRGYKVVFTGLEGQRILVEKEGFDFEPMYYGHITYVKTLKLFFGLWLKNTFDKNNKKMRFRAFYARSLCINYLVEKHQPEIIFLDDHLGHFALYLNKYKCHLVVLNTKLSTTKRSLMPPLNSSFCPNNSMWSKLKTEWLWLTHISKRNWVSFIENITFNGMGEISFHRRCVKKRNFNSEIYLTKKNSIYDGLRNVPSVVLAPEYLEIALQNEEEVVFYSNLKIERDESSFLTEDYRMLCVLLKRRQKEAGTKIILVAFGTISGLAHQKVKMFIEKLTLVLLYNPNWHFLISTAGINVQLSALPNISVLGFVPQIDALTWVNAVITHGGLTTIKECLQAQVPMLIYPYNFKADAPTNGMRVQKRKYGINGKMNENCATIAQKLSKVLDLKLPKPQLDEDLPNGLLNLLDLKEGFANQK